MNSRLAATGSQEAGFTQPRHHSFAQPRSVWRNLPYRDFGFGRRIPHCIPHVGRSSVPRRKAVIHRREGGRGKLGADDLTPSITPSLFASLVYTRSLALGTKTTPMMTFVGRRKPLLTDLRMNEQIREVGAKFAKFTLHCRYVRLIRKGFNTCSKRRGVPLLQK